MKIQPRNYFAQKTVLSILVLFLTTFTLVNFYKYIGSPTDENLFTNPPSHLYIIREIPVQNKSNKAVDHSDKITVGDLLISIDKKKPDNVEEVKNLLSEFTADSEIPFRIFRTVESRYKNFTVLKSAIPDSLVRKIPPSAYVISVTSGGASDRAGMKPGDLILRINGQSFTDAFDADRLLREGQIGKASNYDILRSNQELSLRVTLAKFGISLSLLVMFISGLVYMGLGSLILLKRPYIRAALLQGLAFLLIGFFISTSLFQRIEDNLFANTRSFLLISCVYLGTAIWFNACYYFPKERPQLIAKKWIRKLNYILAGSFSLAIAAPTFVFDLAGSSLYGIVSLAILAFLIILNVAILIKFRKLRSTEQRHLRRIISRVSSVAGITAIVLAVYWIWTDGFTLLGFIGLPLVFIPLVYLHVIAHYGLLDLSIKVRRNVQYSVVSSVWIILLLVIYVYLIMFLSQLEITIPRVEVRSTFIEVMDESLPAEESNRVNRVMLMFLLVGATVMVWKGGKQGQVWINRKFHRSKYDYRQSASELAEVISNNLNMYDLSRGMVLKIAALMHLKQAGVLFFKDEKVCCSQAIYGFQSQKWEDFCMKSEEEITTSLQKFHGEISVDYLPPIIKENLRNHGFLYIIPIRSKDKLLGAILVGEKLSEATYHKEDLEFLAALAKQASVAIENAFLYEELTDRERLKHELNIARQIQMASLPQSTPQIEGLDIAGFSLPAFEVGGDYYDYLNGSDSELTVIVGDVSGKGTSAALYMSKIQGILRSLHTFDLSPRELFIRANDVLYQDIEKKSFVTAIGGAFNVRSRKLIVARAGHLPLFHFKSEKNRVEQVIPHGIGLGLENSGKFAETIIEMEISFCSKDVFLFATDGITESFSDRGEEFGEANVEKIIKKYADEDAQSILNKCIAGIKEFSGNTNQHDDITLVVVKIL